jgi:hypothetical protein
MQYKSDRITAMQYGGTYHIEKQVYVASTGDNELQLQRAVQRMFLKYATHQSSHEVHSKTHFFKNKYVLASSIRATFFENIYLTDFFIPFHKPSLQPTHRMGRAMAQAVSRRPPTAKTRVRSRGSVNVGFVVDEVALGQVFLRALRVSPVNYIPPVLQYLEKGQNNNNHRVAQ